MARQLTNRQAKRSRKSKGFTLIELMVVTAIAGALGAIAVPKFLDARALAQTKGAVGGAVGLARECASYIAAGASDSGMTPPTDCEPESGDSTFSVKIGGNAMNGVECLGTASEDQSETTGTGTAEDPYETTITKMNTVVVKVTSDGNMSCDWANT